jgi:carbon storage regulator
MEAGMFVLTRKIGEAIYIGEGVEVEVLGVERGRVKLGFKAPPGVPIQRGEVGERGAIPSSRGEPLTDEVVG